MMKDHLNKIINTVVKYRKLVIISTDILVIFFSNFLINVVFHTNYINIFYKTFLIQPIIYSLIFIMFNIYNRLWRCADIKDLSIFFSASILAGVIYNIYLALNYQNINLDYCITTIFISSTLLSIYRIFYSLIRKFIINNNFKPNNKATNINTIIIDLEKNLNKLPLQLITLDKDHYNVKGIISDNPFIKNNTANGIKILGTIDETKDLCLKNNIHKILISDNLLSNNNIIKILEDLIKNNIKFFKFNTIENLNNLHKLNIDVKKINISDLLGREIIDVKIPDIKSIRNKTILVTGGGGSIGSELCRQISGYNPKNLIILDNYENNAYSIEQELIRTYGNNLPIKIEIASIQDNKKLEKIFNLYKPDLVFHAAAHKHVPLMEHNPEEAIKNNVFGTLNVVKMADKYNVEKFVLISSDKAVNPTNIMGATKRITEMIIQYYSIFSCTDFVAVRFGNVLGSNGSVIPLFKKQIESGGPITVTHPNVVRYFMTISEAVGLILQACEIAKGGEIFVLDMGEPIKIKDLAENMVKLSGLTLGKDINIEYIGLRPGEKLYEELLMDEEGLQKTFNNKIYIGKPIEINMSQFSQHLITLKQLVDINDSDGIFDFIPKIVNTYKNNNKKHNISLIEKAI